MYSIAVLGKVTVRLGTERASRVNDVEVDPFCFVNFSDDVPLNFARNEHPVVRKRMVSRRCERALAIY